MGTEGVEIETQESFGASFWFEHRCADRCSEDSSCQAYEYSKNRGECKLWREAPAPVSDYSWITCGVKGESVQVESTALPTSSPTVGPTMAPTARPTTSPTNEPTAKPTELPTDQPTYFPTNVPTSSPTAVPTAEPTDSPTIQPTSFPTNVPTKSPTTVPTSSPTVFPTAEPTATPTSVPTDFPTNKPTASPTNKPSNSPTSEPAKIPTATPTIPEPTVGPTAPHQLNKSEWTAYMNSWTASLSAQFYQLTGETAAICGVSSLHNNWVSTFCYRKEQE